MSIFRMLTPEGVTPPLNKACQEGHKDIVKMLLDKQAAVNIQDDKGWTPLLLACLKGHKDIVKMLLEKHADVNMQIIAWRSYASANRMS
jgi:ankyrin repeat protein